MRLSFLAMLAACLVSFSTTTFAADESKPLQLRTRTRVETSPGSGRFHTVNRPEEWDPAHTAIVICDMWDKHWCKGATRRVAEMAPRMNEVISAARKRGVLIIHCPSDTMKFYNGTPERKLAQDSPKVAGRTPIPDRCSLDFKKEHGLPIDDSDGGCNCVPQCKQGSPWRRQIDTLKIEPGDAVTDSAEAFYLMRERGIDNVILMGVHTNMCVLGRPFAIRQMVQQGQRVVLMRDMTDTMYNSRQAPYVSHFTGNDLVVEHIEKYWCPTISSVDLVGGKTFRFSEDKRKHLAIIMAEDEYKTNETLPPFALSHFGQDFKVSLIYGDDKSRDDIPGLEILDDADIALLSIRRRVIPAEHLAHVRKFVADGKAVVGIRTASHSFAPKDIKSPPAGHEVWASFDPEVLGGNYHGHYNNKGVKPTTIWPIKENISHPILIGISGNPFPVTSWLYKTAPLVKGTTPLLMGQIEGSSPEEVMAWAFTRKDGGKSFYVGLGHPDDFAIADFRRILSNSIYWAADLPIPEKFEERPALSAKSVSAAGILYSIRAGLEQAKAKKEK